MAKQTGDIIIEGTIDDMTFYKMDGKGYARSKSCLKGERVKRDPRFKRTMKSAGRFARGNRLASKVYRSLPRQEQVYVLFKELKHLAILGLKEGKEEAAVMGLLLQHIKKNGEVKKTGAVKTPTHGPGKAGGRKKTPRLFRVYGSRGKDVRELRREGKRLLRRVCHRGKVCGAIKQRE
jgi:hypothetical protein